MKDIKGVEELNPVTKHLEFFGPAGCLLFTITLPLFPIMLNVLCSVEGCPNFNYEAKQIIQDAINFDSFVFYLSWFCFQLISFAVIPGNFVKGVKLRNGITLEYKINAFRCLVFTHIVMFFYCYFFNGLEVLNWIAENTVQICFAAITFGVIQSVLLYIYSFRSEDVLLSTVGNSGYFFHDFWIGRELNPRLPYSDSKLLDLKYFCELRPGMFLWAVLNYAYLAKQYLNGGLQNSMLFVCFGQLIYIVDSVWCESSILTTMDITTDGFGSSNGQKNLFKTNPLHSSLKNLKYIKTESGSKLLITGWWGISRHINYFGDWLMGLSWCLATGFTTPLPYFYIFYFAALLIHRAQRDDVKCREKYGKDWEKYCSIVKYKIIPYVY